MKNYFTFFVIILTFLFFPKENRLFLFHSSKDTFYGEMHFKGTKDGYIIAKNFSDEKVTIKGNEIKSNISIQIANGYNFYPESTKIIYPNSYSILCINEDSNNTVTTRSFGGYKFNPYQLEILTNAEKEYKFVIYILIGFLIGILVYLITMFSIKSKSDFSYE